MSTQDLYAHLAEGAAHVCQCWLVTRNDGQTFGFTDHDCDLSFAGNDFIASSGMSARALSAGTGLAVDNSEAIGLLQSDVISESDIMAGRFDGAEVRNWLVRWDRVSDRVMRFFGTIGEISCEAGQFQAELRGLSDALNQPQGRSFLRSCSCILGDSSCAFDVKDPAFSDRLSVTGVTEAGSFVFNASGFADRWFDQGKFIVKTGAAQGLTGAIKQDRRDGSSRTVTLWHPILAVIVPGDEVELIAGCDKRAETCRDKFDNFENFQGFPHIPGEDWLMAVPRAANSGTESMN